MALTDILTRVFGCIGVIASLSVIAAYFISKTFRESVIARLCVAISFADFISVGAQMLGALGPDAGPSSFLCQVQAAFQHFGEVAAALIITCIAINLLMVVKSKSTLEDINSYDAYYIPTSYSIAGIIAVVPMWLRDINEDPAYGSVGTWCYIIRNAKMLMFTLYGPIIFTFFFNFATFSIVKLEERKKMRENAMFRGFSVDDPRLDALPGIISLYIVVFSITWLPMMTLFIYKLFYPNANLSWLLMVNSVCLPSRGLTDGLVAFYQAWRSKNPIVNRFKPAKLNSF
jgi:hypothetical protein